MDKNGNPLTQTTNPNERMIMSQFKTEKKGGFFDLPQDRTCKDKSHEPPTHIHIPQGKGYRHICPSCGKVTELIPSQISF